MGGVVWREASAMASAEATVVFPVPPLPVTTCSRTRSQVRAPAASEAVALAVVTPALYCRIAAASPTAGRSHTGDPEVSRWSQPGGAKLLRAARTRGQAGLSGSMTE